MKQPAYIIFLLAGLGGMNAAGQATIEGTVQLPKAASTAVSTSRYVGAANPGAPEPPKAVVYLEGKFPVSTSTNKAPVKMAQKDLQFGPGILPVQVGTIVEFPNEDDIFHSVFSYSKPKSFDLGRYQKNEKPAAQVFDKPGVVRVSCDIHEHMRGIILVLETPYFQKTDADGHFRLENLPLGKYTLKAWLNEKTTPLSREVELESGKPLQVDFMEEIKHRSISPP